MLDARWHQQTTEKPVEGRIQRLPFATSKVLWWVLDIKASYRIAYLEDGESLSALRSTWKELLDRITASGGVRLGGQDTILDTASGGYCS